jgi:hypothetical protein
MKESFTNTFNDLLNNDIITKTKSTFHDFVSGVKNLFRHQSGNSGDEGKSSTDGINNYLKSPEEIEAEFRLLSAPGADDTKTETLMVAFNSYSAIIDKPGINSETGESRIHSSRIYGGKLLGIIPWKHPDSFILHIAVLWNSLYL